MLNLRRLFPYLRPYLWHLVAALLLAIPLAVIRTAPAIYTQKLIDDLFTSRDASKLLWFTLGFVGLYVINFPIRLDWKSVV